jgi:hypothetical protein
MFTRPADERRCTIREHAQAVSYRILGPVIILVALYLIYAPMFLDYAWLPSTAVEQAALTTRPAGSTCGTAPIAPAARHSG